MRVVARAVGGNPGHTGYGNGLSPCTEGCGLLVDRMVQGLRGEAGPGSGGGLEMLGAMDRWQEDREGSGRGPNGYHTSLTGGLSRPYGSSPRAHDGEGQAGG